MEEVWEEDGEEQPESEVREACDDLERNEKETLFDMTIYEMQELLQMLGRRLPSEEESRERSRGSKIRDNDLRGCSYS